MKREKEEGARGAAVFGGSSEQRGGGPMVRRFDRAVGSLVQHLLAARVYRDIDARCTR